MDIARAVTFVFEDRQAAEKLLITAIVGFFSLVLTPLLIGLIGWAAILGYQIEIIRNIRRGVKHPLPRWDNFSPYISEGFYALLAILIYNIPTVIIAGFTSLLAQGAGNTFVGSTLFVVVSCCFAPIVIVYNIIIAAMFTLAQGRYTDDPNFGTYFDIGYLLVTLRDNLGLTIQWALAAFIVTLTFAIVNLVPLIGTVVGLALLIPIQGALSGQYARAVLGPLKPKSNHSAVP